MTDNRHSTDESNRPAVVYDDACRFCVGSVRVGAALDRERALDFVPASTERGRALLEAAGVSAGDPESFVVARGVDSSLRSDASLEVIRRLPAVRWLAPLVAAVSTPARDAAYNVIARNRYRLFGRLDRR